MSENKADNSTFNDGTIQPAEKSLNICGVKFQIDSDAPEIIDWLSFDFAGFRSESFLKDIKKSVRFSYFTKIQAPKPPPVSEVLRCSSFVCYDSNGVRHIDYFGRAVLIYNYKEEHGQIYSADIQFGYERLYLAILSRLGLFMDGAGFHRVHALGVSAGRRAHVFLLPQRGGKTTLALSLLSSSPSIKLISEDTPVFSETGLCLPFPFRLGTRDEDLPFKIEHEHLRKSISANGEAKMLINTLAFKNQIESDALPVTHIYVCKWTGAEEPELKRTSRINGFLWLFRDCVIGLGVPQVSELFLKMTFSDFLQKTVIALRRLWTILRVAVKAECSIFTLCSDREKNTALITAAFNREVS